MESFTYLACSLQSAVHTVLNDDIIMGGTSSRYEEGCTVEAVLPSVECSGHKFCIRRSAAGMVL